MVMRSIGILALVLATAGLFGCSKSSNSSSSSATAASAAVATPSSPAGASMYVANCASCHQPDGKGLTGSFPPLAGSAIVTGGPAKLIHIVKYGLTGPVVLAGKTYNGMMPAWSPQLSDADIATTLTYIRASWGNRASAVTAMQVGAVSK